MRQHSYSVLQDWILNTSSWWNEVHIEPPNGKAWRNSQANWSGVIHLFCLYLQRLYGKLFLRVLYIRILCNGHRWFTSTRVCSYCTQNAGPCTLSDSWIGHKWIPLAFDYYLNVLVIYKACWVHSKQHSWNLTEHLSSENLFRTSPAKPTARYPICNAYSKGVTSSKSAFIVSLHQISNVFFLFTESFPHVWIGELILCKSLVFYLSQT